MGGIADKFRLPVVDFLQHRDVVEDGEHEFLIVFLGEGREEDLEGVMLAIIAVGVERDGLRAVLAADDLSRFRELGIADDVDAVALQAARRQMEDGFGLRVGVDDIAARVDEHDGVVDVVERQRELMGFGLGFLDFLGQILGQVVDGLHEGIEFIAAVPAQAFVEIAGRNRHGILRKQHDGPDLPVGQPDGNQEGDAEREKETPDDDLEDRVVGVFHRRERIGRADDAGQLPVVPDGDGDVHEVFVQRCAFAHGDTVVRGQCGLDFLARKMIVEAVGRLSRVTEHVALGVHDGDAQSRLVVQAFQRVIERVAADVEGWFKCDFDDFCVADEGRALVFECVVVEVVEQEGSEQGEGRKDDEQKGCYEPARDF